VADHFGVREGRIGSSDKTNERGIRRSRDAVRLTNRMLCRKRSRVCPDTVATTPFAEGMVVLAFNRKPEHLMIQGIDIDRAPLPLRVAPMEFPTSPVTATLLQRAINQFPISGSVGEPPANRDRVAYSSPR